MQHTLIFCALRAEAQSFIDHFSLKPIHTSSVFERFQVFGNEKLSVATTGIGKLRAATATSALLSITDDVENLLLANIGIAGGNQLHCQIGDLFLVNKITDHATQLNYYPDILVKHECREGAVVTYDQPRSYGAGETLLVDMEASGFAHAALTFIAPSQIVCLKVVSDLCDGSKVTPKSALKLVQEKIITIEKVLRDWSETLPVSARLDQPEINLINSLIEHARFSTTEQIELKRVALAAKARKQFDLRHLEHILKQKITSRKESKDLFRSVIEQLTPNELP